jgi:RHS repeat-associated protein
LDGVLEERRNYLQNWRADVVAIADSAGQPVEYVRYSSYGEAVAYPAADVNMDGSVTTADQTAWNSGLPNGDYAFGGDSDLNRDNVVDAADTTFFNASYTANTATGGKGRVSSLSVANRKGYAGYEFDEAASVYHVRHRVYLPESGRWSRRDPLGYVDGMGLYEYVGSYPVKKFDSTGTLAICCSQAYIEGQDILDAGGTDSQAHCVVFCMGRHYCWSNSFIEFCANLKEFTDRLQGGTWVGSARDMAYNYLCATAADSYWQLASTARRKCKSCCGAR